MVIYSLFALLQILLNLIIYSSTSNDKKNKDKVYLTVNGLFLWIISSLRDISVGTDVRSYKMIFSHLGSVPLSVDVPKQISGYMGYRIICRIVYLITKGNYQIMLSICAFITIYGLCKFIYYFSDNCIESLFFFESLYYLFESWNTVRQFLAMSLMLLAFLEYKKKNLVKFILLVIISVSIHSIAIIMLAFVVFDKIKWNKLIFGIYSLSLVFIMKSLNGIITMFMNIFPRYSMYLYVFDDASKFAGIAQGRKIIISLIFLLAIVVGLIFIKKRGIDKPLNCRYENSPFVSTWTFWALIMIEITIGIMFSHNSFFLRIQTFFSFFSIFMLPSIVERLFKLKKAKITVYLATNLLFLFSTIIRLTENLSGVFPYEFFL